MLDHRLERFSDMVYLDRKPGLTLIRHKPSGCFLLATGDVRKVIRDSLNYLKTGRYHNPKLQALFKHEDEIEYEYSYTDDARGLRATIMKDYYGDHRILNNADWPKWNGAYKLVHKPSGSFYVGAVTDLIKARSYQATLLRTGKHKSQAFQALFDESKSFDDIGWEWAICSNIEEAESVAKLWKAENDELCLNSKRFHGGVGNLGVYVIKHDVTGCYYVGSAANLRGRWSTHQYHFKNGTHVNARLKAHTKKHGNLWSVEYSPTETREEAYHLEQLLITRGKRDPLMLNLSDNAKSSITFVMKDPRIKRRAKALAALAMKRPEVIEKRNKSLRDRWANDETLKGSRTGALNPFAKRIMVNGVVWGSLNDAIRSGTVKESFLRKALKDPTNKDVYYLS